MLHIPRGIFTSSSQIASPNVCSQSLQENAKQSDKAVKIHFKIEKSKSLDVDLLYSFAEKFVTTFNMNGDLRPLGF